MRRGDFYRMLAGGVIGVVVAVSPAGAQTSQPTEAESWQFAVTAYAYLPAISGNAYFPVTGTSTSFRINQSDLVNNLKMAFMGSFDAHYERWGLFADVLYLDLGRHHSNLHDFTIGDVGIPADTTSDVSLDLKAWIVNTVGEYRVLGQGRGTSTLDAVAGVRYLSINETLQWNFTGSIGSLPEAARSGNQQITDNLVYGIVGVKGQLQGDLGFMMPYYLDVGTGGSPFTWQGAIGLGYMFHWGEVSLLYRYIDFHFDTSKLQDLTIAGPMLAATFRW
jgi:hypothetical protein